MPDEYQQSPRIKKVKGNAIYNYYEAPPTGPDKPAKPNRPGRWGWVGGAAAALLLGGTLVTTQLNARVVYYCASHNTVKYHTNATCKWLKQCGSQVKSMSLGKARDKMGPCKVCHEPSSD
jgi:hypothetical protein